MKIAFCYESVLPERGGCEMYIADLARRLAADRHEVHLYACRWDAAALPPGIHYHQLPTPRGPRFLRPWIFGATCYKALQGEGQYISIGFNKTWGQDVLYPLGGLHVASAEHNSRKDFNPLKRGLGRWIKKFDLAHWSFTFLERRQYIGPHQPLIVANSRMVQNHCRRYYGLDPAEIPVIHNAVHPSRFMAQDRLRRRAEFRQRWNIGPSDTVAVFVAMNYRLKGIEPLLHAVRRLPIGQAGGRDFRLLIAGDPITRPYERLARWLGIADKVRFLGHCSETRNCYFAADFLVHPTFYDPCSLVVLEALACGLPVITSRYNGAAELLNAPREGYVIRDPHDHDHLAWCLTQLLDPARRLQCAQAARHTAAQWTFDHHYRMMLQIFAEAAARKHAA